MGMWFGETTDNGDDLLAAPAGTDEGVVDDDLLAPVGEGVKWDPSQGYPDPSQTVRIWVDENKRLTKVRISNRWRERAKGTPLARMFDSAFFIANAQLPSDNLYKTVDDFPHEAVDERELSEDNLAIALERMAELQDRINKLDRSPEDVVPERWVGEQAVGRSSNHMVTVTLAHTGETEKLEFNEEWLKTSRVSEVTDAIMEAHERAYSVYEPPTYEMGDRMRLALESRRQRDQVMAMISRGQA